MKTLWRGRCAGPGLTAASKAAGIVAALASGILLTGCDPAGDLPAETPTFGADIAPIIHDNCAPCHRPGEAGPFSLLTYNDVVRKAGTIAAVTQSRYMPPWPADPGYSHFLGERVLTDTEIALIGAWVEAGSPEGDPLEFTPPEFPENSALGEPDLVLTLPEPIQIEGNNTDQFFVAKIPYVLESEQPIRAVEFVSPNRRLVHHMNAHIVFYEEDRKSDPMGGPYVVNRATVGTLEETYHAINILNDDGSYPDIALSVTNHLPGGSSAVFYPQGIGGWTLSREGAFLIRDIHYGPTPVDAVDRPRLNVFFADAPPARPTREVQMGTLGISEIVPPLIIPPGEVKTFTTSTTVATDISVLTVNPHMHLLGKSYEAFAVRPDGEVVPLIRIPEWDFRWQYFYTLPRMVKLPQGTTIHATGVFDNTADNPNNPFDPPQTVIGTNGSMRVTDEMFQLIMTYVPYQPGDEDLRLDPNAIE